MKYPLVNLNPLLDTEVLKHSFSIQELLKHPRLVLEVLKYALLEVLKQQFV